MEKLIKNKKMILLGVLVIFVFGVVSLIVVVNNKKNDGFEEIGVENFLGENVDNGVENRDIIGNNSEEEAGSSNGNEGSVGKAEIFIHIVGEINNPGVVKINQGQRVVDAIEKAGGATDKADLARINLAFILSDGQKVIIPGVNDKDMESYIVDGGGGSVAFSGKSGALGNGVSLVKQKVNINTAGQSELETLNGIGPSIADKIIKYREKNGKFKRVEDLKNVSGIGESKFEGVKDEVCVK